MKILFLIKGNSGYGYSGPKSGLLESAKLTAKQLVKYLGVHAKVVICVDGNDIDREVHNYNPNICVIEAIWVTPEKIKENVRLHPKVKFIVRIHSEIPFLANEGIALDRIKKYSQLQNVLVSFNSKVTNNDFHNIIEEPIYLPNIYSRVRPKCVSIVKEIFKQHKHKKEFVDIACFGAIRPMKNQLLQAFAAIEFGNENGKIIHFHINSVRTEQGGESVLKNLRALFHNSNHELIEHTWLPRKEFLELISSMDIGMQVSFSESFNIVTADFVKCGIPIIVSEAIRWMPSELKVKFDVKKINELLRYVFKFYDYSAELNKKFLNSHNEESLTVWEHFLNGY